MSWAYCAPKSTTRTVSKPSAGTLNAGLSAGSSGDPGIVRQAVGQTFVDALLAAYPPAPANCAVTSEPGLTLRSVATPLPDVVSVANFLPLTRNVTALPASACPVRVASAALTLRVAGNF